MKKKSTYAAKALSKLCIMHYALCIIATLLATACGHDDLVVPEEEQVQAPTPYVELRIAVPLANPYSTRANPMGGEEGNGRERGVLNEDKIHDINVFFYIEEKDNSGKGLGMDSKDDTSIIKHIYYNLDNHSDSDNTKELEVKDQIDNNAPDYWGQGYVYLRFECTEEEVAKVKDTGINFVAIANAGKLQYTEGMKMKALRDMKLNYKETQSWTTTVDVYSLDASKMNYFLMSTAYNEDSRFGSNKISNAIPGKENEYTGTTTLQRLYARLDLWYNKEKNAITSGTGNTEKVDELKYEVEEGGGNIVYITNVLPVNVMKDPSYLFKKVTAVNESWSTDNTIWNRSKLNSVTSFSWGGKESPNDLPVSNPDFPKNYVMERHTMSKEVGGNSPADSLDAWYGKSAKSEVIKNINKNNTSETTDGHFSAYYHMQRAAGTNDPNYGCDHISIISYANENTHPTDCFHSNYLTGMAFRAVFVPEKIYKSSAASDDDIVTASDNVEHIYRYSPTDRSPKERKSVYFISKTDAENYGKAKKPGDSAVITEFIAQKHGNEWGFTCYYNLWLRHYNDVNDNKTDPNPNFPMEYATVRNNIYRVAVSFTGPGDPTPTMREPDTMKARIFVRKWNYREESPIDF